MAKLSSINFSAIRKAVVADLQAQATAIGKGWNGAELLAAKTIKRTWLREKNWREMPANLEYSEYNQLGVEISYVYSVGIIQSNGFIKFLSNQEMQPLLEGGRESGGGERTIMQATERLSWHLRFHEGDQAMVIAKVVTVFANGGAAVREKSCRVYTRD
jgi:hypothetical protein